jgi:hypothetical protein
MMSPDDPKQIDTVAALVEALGGFERMAELFGGRSGTVRMWRDRGYIPPRHYLKHASLLKARGISADPAIWNQEAEAA